MNKDETIAQVQELIDQFEATLKASQELVKKTEVFQQRLEQYLGQLKKGK